MLYSSSSILAHDAPVSPCLIQPPCSIMSLYCKCNSPFLFFSLSLSTKAKIKNCLPITHSRISIAVAGSVIAPATFYMLLLSPVSAAPAEFSSPLPKRYGVQSHNLITMLFSPLESIDRPLFNLIESFQGCLGLPVIFSHHLERLLNATQAKFLVLFRAAVFVFLLSKALDFFAAISHTNKTQRSR